MCSAKPFALPAIILFFVSALFVGAQEEIDNSKVVGIWQVEIDADGDLFFLTLELVETDGNLEGIISEQSGAFSNVPLSEIVFDGATLTFEFLAPTPPDGLERFIEVELEVSDSEMEGTLTVPDLGFTALATATRDIKVPFFFLNPKIL